MWERGIGEGQRGCRRAGRRDAGEGRKGVSQEGGKGKMGSEFGFDSPNPTCRKESIVWAHYFHWKSEDTEVLLCATQC